MSYCQLISRLFVCLFVCLCVCLFVVEVGVISTGERINDENNKKTH